jgi:hypothetical protein
MTETHAADLTDTIRRLTLERIQARMMVGAGAAADYRPSPSTPT